MSNPKAAAGLPRSVPAAIARARAWFAALSRPMRVLLATTGVVAVLLAAVVAVEKANEPFSPLFTQLDRDDAAAIVAKLKEQKVPYRVEVDGTTIEVPESKARELRLELAGSGLPRGGGVGFESFDKMRLGASDFEQRVLYRRALEGELTRTIGTLGAVESARVHLVLPEKSVFITRGEPASASIVLRLRPGRSIGPSEVGGVVHLVASAVPGLQPDHITVVTTDGTTLHRPRRSGAAGEADGADGDDDDDARVAARSYEASLEDRIKGMLERVVGPGHADVRVTAEIDPARVERVEEHYDPSKSVLRSEEQSVEHTSADPNASAVGVPGAESNLPSGTSRGSAAPKGAPVASSAASAAPAKPPAVLGAAQGAVRESHTRNYEIDHVSEKRIIGGGSLRRLTVAVVLDGVKDGKGMVPRSQDELDKLATLVRSAAGASDARGDVVTVESIPFAASVDAPEEMSHAGAPVASTRTASLNALKKWAPAGVGVVVLLAAFGLVLRGRRAPKARSPEALPAVSAPPALEAAVKPVLDSGDLRTQALSRAIQDPATAALVLRFWLGTAAAPDAREGARG